MLFNNNSNVQCDKNILAKKVYLALFLKKQMLHDQEMITLNSFVLKKTKHNKLNTFAFIKANKNKKQIKYNSHLLN